MRVALYDSGNVQALCTIELSEEQAAAPRAYTVTFEILPGRLVEVKLCAVMIHLVGVKEALFKTWAVAPVDEASVAICRLPFFPEEDTLEIPPQHRREAARRIREALKMGDAR